MSKREPRIGTGLTNRVRAVRTAASLLESPNHTTPTRVGRTRPLEDERGAQILAVGSPVPAKRANAAEAGAKEGEGRSRSRTEGCSGQALQDATTTTQFDFRGFRGSGSQAPFSNRQGSGTRRAGLRSGERDGTAQSGGSAVSATASEMSWRMGPRTVSKGVHKLQKLLHSDQATPFSAMQEAVIEQRGSGASCRTQIAKGIFKATGAAPTDAVLDELVTLCEGKDDFRFGKLADALWEDALIEHAEEVACKTHASPSKHLFQPSTKNGFYNDNVAPSVRTLSVRKSSSSVRYDLFTNGNRREIINSPVPPAITEEVAQTLNRVPDEHPVTRRPLDPYLSYLTMQQGRRFGAHQRHLPINIITVQPLDAPHAEREWQTLPTVSFAFSKLHNGHEKGAEWRNRVF